MGEFLRRLKVIEFSSSFFCPKQLLSSVAGLPFPLSLSTSTFSVATLGCSRAKLEDGMILLGASRYL